MSDIMCHNISEKKLFYFSEILCFTQNLQLRSQELLHEKVKVYGRSDRGSLSQKKQTRAMRILSLKI